MAVGVSRASRGVLAAMFLALSAVGAAAQGGDRIRSLIEQVFVDGSAEIRPEARERLRRAATPGDCPRKFTFDVRVPGSEPADQSLAVARAQALDAFLKGQGLCAQNCDIWAETGAAGAELAVESVPLPDTVSPALAYGYTPESQIVRRGETVRLDLAGLDRYDNAQSGIRSILVDRRTETGALTADMREFTFPPPAAGCREPPPEAEALYEYPVTAASPRLLRFFVTVTDHAGNFYANEAIEFRVADLSGIWRDEANGEEVRIAHSGATVTATYLQPHECSHGGGAPISTLDNFTGDIVAGDKIEGKLTVCRYDSSSMEWILADLELAIESDWSSLYGAWTPVGGGDFRPIGFTYLRED